jgi:hypothetical protein
MDDKSGENMEMPLSQVKSLIEFTMPNSDLPTRAAIEALLFAQSNPGSLVKITCSNTEEAIAICEYLAVKATANQWHQEREKGTVSHDQEGWPILELRNGSGVVIVLEKKRKKP